MFKVSKKSGAKIVVTDCIEAAVNKVDFLYTDVWLSMGEDKSLWQKRIQLLKPYRVTMDIIQLTDNPQVKFMHCLPAFHNRETREGEEIYQKYSLD